MVSALGLDRRGVLLLWVGASLLACIGIELSSPSLEDASYAEAAAAGYTLPAEAEHISVHDFGSMDVRSTHFRYTLPESVFEALLEESRADGRYTEHREWSVPPSWPDYSIFGEDAAVPAWWQPSGEVVFRRSESAVLEGPGSDMGTGAQMAFDERTHTVFLWQWQWQWWRHSPIGDPLMVEIDDGLMVSAVEVRCAGGYRKRGAVSGGQAVFRDIPELGDCHLTLRGGSPYSVPLEGRRQLRCAASSDGVQCQEP